MGYLNMCRISTPAWAREPQRRIKGHCGLQAFLAFEPSMSVILDELHRRVEAFVNDPDQTYEDRAWFPQKARLTGEYYLSDRTYSCETSAYNRRDYYYMSIQVHCLEKQWLEHQTNFDYLGLEQGVMMWRDTGEIELDPHFDTSSI